MFSKACEYGIRATILIAVESQKGRRISLKDIAKEIDSPVAFTAKILQALAKEDIIQSVQGAYGGYEMDSQRLQNVNLGDIVRAIDGDIIFNGCGLGLRKCNDLKPCPVHFRYKVIRENLKSMLQNTTVENLTSELETGLTFLKL